MKKTSKIRFKEALKILSEKMPVSRLAFRDWCDRGYVKFTTEKHGMFEYRIFDIDEIKRIKDLLPKERINGLPLLPRKKNSPRSTLSGSWR